MALEITKKNSVFTPKYLLSKKEISEEQFHSLVLKNDQVSQQDKPFSFSSDQPINNNKHSEFKPEVYINNETKKKKNNNCLQNNKGAPKLIDIEEKLSNEIKKNYLQKEQKMERQTKDEYSKAILEYKSQAESTTKNERQIIELQLYQKWQENCDELLYECKTQDRNQKEILLEEKMKERLEVQIKKELFKSEYDKVVEKIRREVQQEIANEFIQKKQKEINHIKKKIEYSTQIKLSEYEKQLIQQYKESYEKEKKEITEEKEKEIKSFYKDKLIQMKEKAKKDLNEKYTLMSKELGREIDDMKNQYAIQSEKEKKRLAKLNEMQFSCLQEEIIHKEKNKEINKLLTVCKMNDSNSQLKQNEFNRPQTILRKSNSKSNIPTRNMRLNIDNSDITNDKTVNIFEVNNRIKYSSPRNESQIYSNKHDLNKNDKAKEYNHFLIKNR